MSLLVTWILRCCTLYILIGIIFAIYFVWRGVDKLDEAAQGAKRLTSALWFPGALLLWPVLWWLLSRLKQNMP